MEKEESTGTAPEKAKAGINIKVLLLGLPLFIIQLVAVYFITANFLLNKMQTQTVDAQEVKKNDKSVVAKEKPAEYGKFIHEIQDQIINPAGTDGRRLLMVSLGFDVPSEENKKELEAKDVLLKDEVLSVMSSKGLAELGSMAYRDTLRTEITDRLKTVMPSVKINKIYFSKYILQ
ncbi:MAG: flagellar basal body-associated protein FliL [Ignavibacteria bacterium]|nr:MAG: flagellar basal body-associated protein FliL [Ignavibacteria bacterium]KAF0160127.1 MAG: flagellar basal body-associated protein FliL [Ignavibacteria bacterium]